MVDWFRSWHGAPIDPKWRTVARKADCRPGDVAAIVWFLLDRASACRNRGSIAGYDVEVIADTLGYETNAVERVLTALREKRFVDDTDRVVGWEKHQPVKEDSSTARTQAYRERRKTATEHGDAAVTTGDAAVTTGDASERENLKRDDPREEESREEKKETRLLPPDGGGRQPKPSNGSLFDIGTMALAQAPLPTEVEILSAPTPRYPQAFQELWDQYREHIGEKNSSKAKSYGYWKRLSQQDQEDCHMGLAEYCIWAMEERKKRSDTKLKHLETFINGRNWEAYLEKAQ